MNKFSIRLITVLVCLLSSYSIFAEVSPFKTNLTNSYYSTDHHEIVINSSAEKVWPHLKNLSSWMLDFDMEHVSGPVNSVGEVLRLYKGADYFFEITRLISNKLMVGIFMPMTSPQGETFEGFAMLTLTEFEGKTEVSIFMNRKASWFKDEPNPTRKARESEEFTEDRKETFSRFLTRLRELSEGSKK